MKENKKGQEKIEVYVGIDVSKEKLDVSLLPTGEYFQVPNDEEGRKEIKERLSPYLVRCIVLEPSGGYEREVLSFLLLNGFPCSLVNAKSVREFARATGKLAKTDKIDAFVLAWYGEAIKPKVAEVRGEIMQELRELVERRGQLVKMKASEENRLRFAKGEVREDIIAHIQWLEGRIREIERKIDEKLKLDEEAKGKVELLESVVGVGRMTAVTMVVKLPELGKVSHKKIASLVGVAPMSDDSGKRKGKREIKGGRKEVRAALYMATLVAIRFNLVIRDYYERLVGRGKAKKAAIVACMRKVLVIMNAMMRDKEPFKAGGHKK